MATVKRTSALTGKTTTMDMKGYSLADIMVWIDAGPDRPFVQDAFPLLSDNEREFLLTGVTPEEWDDAMEEIEC